MFVLYELGRITVGSYCPLFWHFYPWFRSHAFFHPPTWNIGDSLGMLPNLWISIGEWSRCSPTWKLKPNRVSAPSSRWWGSMLFIYAADLLHKALTKASPSPLAQFLLWCLQFLVHIQQTCIECLLCTWRYPKCWACRSAQDRDIPGLIRRGWGLRNFHVMENLNDIRVFGPSWELATHYYICMWI